MTGQFSAGQRLKVTDNTGKPYRPIVYIEVLRVLGYDHSGRPEYEVRYEDPEVNPRTGHLETTGEWGLETAIAENRIFVEVL